MTTTNPLSSHVAPHCKLKALPSSAVCWTSGFWADRFELCHKAIIPSMRTALEDPKNSAFLENFHVVAGLTDGKHTGTMWSDGDCYKWMEAVAYVYGVTHDEELNRQLDDLIEVIGKAQEDDGYICTQIQLTDKKRWEKFAHHELYNMGHLMTTASVHHRVTGKDSFLTIARKLGDHLCEVFLPQPPELAHFGFNPSNIMGAVDLYRATGEKKYLELAGTFVTMRGSQPGGSDQNQARVSLREETEAVGHAVTATYLYAGAADVYAETGERALLDALARIWDDVTQHKMYITGGVGPFHHGLSVRRDQIHEAFAAEYELPNSTAYNETCANIGNAMWNWRMLAITGDTKYADVMEQVIYNTGLSGMSLDGTRFCYTNPLRWHGESQQMLSQDAPSRWSTFTCYCCPPQVGRTIARMYEWAYSLSDEGVWVHLFGGSRLDTQLADGAPIRLTQNTRYPWNGHVKIVIDEAPEHDLSVFVRIPGWAEGATLCVNGNPLPQKPQPGAYAEMRRTWAAGDRIELDLPMAPRLVRAHPRVEALRNQVAVMRGPVVYCLESVDLPEGVNISEVHLPRDTALVPRHDDDLLGGLTLIEGEARRIVEADWTGTLYQTATDCEMATIPVTLIPYYAWNNRGVTEMTVWMPVC